MAQKTNLYFAEKKKKVSTPNKFSVSYVCSFPTCITRKETIYTGVSLLFEHNPGSKLTKAELKKCSLQQHVYISFSKVRFIIIYIVLPWVLPLLIWLIF